MRHHTFTAVLLLLISTVSYSAGQNFRGDTLAQGQQFASTSMSLTDWYYAADFIGNTALFDSEGEPIQDPARNYADAKGKGYDFKTTLTYMFGLTNDLTLGIQYGYVYQKDETSIDSTLGGDIEGDWVTEGGTDLTFNGKYRLDETTSADAFLQIPVCSSSAASDFCNSKLPLPENSQQDGYSGGQGKGYYRFGGGVSSHWITEMDTHWMGSLFAAATISDDVAGNKVSSPFTYGASFGGIFPIQQNHQWTIELMIERMMAHKAYSPQVQQEVSFSEHGIVSVKGEYLWDFMARLQLRPFARMEMVQNPSLKFTRNGVGQRLEYTAGTRVTLGAELRATF